MQYCTCSWNELELEADRFHDRHINFRATVRRPSTKRRTPQHANFKVGVYSATESEATIRNSESHQSPSPTVTVP